MKSNIENIEYEGVWKISSTILCPNCEHTNMPDITIFKYENEHITIHLASLHKTDWKSDDEFYTLRSRWERNALCYLPPVGIWTKLAFFEDQKFVNISDGTKKIFEKISEDKIVGWDRAILNPRSLFKYGSEASGDKAS